MKKQILTIAFAGLLSTIWNYQFLSDRNNLLIIVGYFVSFIAIRIIANQFISLIATLLITAGISFVSINYIPVFFPFVIFMILLRYVSLKQNHRRIKKDGFFCFTAALFIFSMLTSAAFFVFNDSVPDIEALIHNRKSMFFILNEILFVYLLIRLQKNASEQKASNNKNYYYKDKLKWIFIFQLITVFILMLLALKWFFPITVCAFAPLLCSYDLITNEKALQLLV